MDNNEQSQAVLPVEVDEEKDSLANKTAEISEKPPSDEEFEWEEYLEETQTEAVPPSAFYHMDVAAQRIEESSSAVPGIPESGRDLYHLHKQWQRRYRQQEFEFSTASEEDYKLIGSSNITKKYAWDSSIAHSVSGETTVSPDFKKGSQQIGENSNMEVTFASEILEPNNASLQAFDEDQQLCYQKVMDRIRNLEK
ncbi:uncharacterized protein LOC135217221 [Macrobrachium nipponense]|uniref:uncharacterized protein LOC135217221 n=1 Tax=Macrobrachium nipponense TaxID=159736 RepID=UPI0030C80D92